jgi:ADP-ribose pyrophosphatase YjhB (NUDIX family)
MKTSCGAILYTFNNFGELGIILGEELDECWLPFKGCNENGESLEETAIREINEETCGLIQLDSIELEHVFTTKRKKYHIGICEVPYDIIEKFEKAHLLENRIHYKEKKQIKFFPINECLNNDKIHSISKASIRFYWNKLKYINKYKCKIPDNCKIMSGIYHFKGDPIKKLNNILYKTNRLPLIK